MDAETNIRWPEAVSKWFKLTSASQIGGSSAFADEEPRWSGSFWPFRAVDGLPVVWRDFHWTSTLPQMWSASLSFASQNFAYASLGHPQHPGYFSLGIAICQQPDKFAAVFALANFVALSPLKVQRNIKSLYWDPTLHKSIKVVMARQTSLQVTTPELTFFLLLSLSSPQTILTVFGHKLWLRNGSIKSKVICSAIEHTTRNNNYWSNSHKCHLVVMYIYIYNSIALKYFECVSISAIFSSC